MKLIRIKEHLTVILNDGSMLTSTTCTDEIYNKIVENQDNDIFVKGLLVPEMTKKEEEVIIKTKLLSDFNDSKYLSTFGSSVYLKGISELTVPEDLAIAILTAELNKDQEKLQSYLNFWTLASLNPDSRARMNLFWFLQRYGMTISKSGLFVAYRNVNLKSEGSGIDTKLADFVSAQYIRVKTKLKKSPKNYFVGYSKTDNGEELIIYTDIAKFNGKAMGSLADLYTKLSDENISPVYTDAHSGTFTIQIGQPVTMPREECDSKQENTCSNGLHVAGRSWLANGYFGQISLMVLVNPADVVAVPPSDNYDKMRVCAYYPIALIKRDKDGQIIDEKIDDGFEDDFIEKIAYEGDINNKDEANYSIVIPDIPEISRQKIIGKLQEISKSMKKYVN